jgi:hypothetical protein
LGLVVREGGIKVSERALGRVSLELNTERAKTEATWKGYLEKLRVHMARIKQTHGLDKMLEEKKVLLEEKKRDLTIWEAMLAESQVHDIHPWENQDQLAELVELRGGLADVEVDHLTEAEELATLEAGIPQVPNKAQEVLEVAGSAGATTLGAHLHHRSSALGGVAGCLLQCLPWVL